MSDYAFDTLDDVASAAVRQRSEADDFYARNEHAAGMRNAANSLTERLHELFGDQAKAQNLEIAPGKAKISRKGWIFTHTSIEEAFLLGARQKDGDIIEVPETNELMYMRRVMNGHSAGVPVVTSGFFVKGMLVVG